MATIKRFVHFKTKEDLLVTSSYVLFTHCFDIFDNLPFLLVTGPFASGKTQLLEVLHKLCLRARFSSHISPAAFYRAIEDERPTLIIDEAEDLQRYRQRSFIYPVFSSGHRRDGCVILADPRSGGTIQFSTYGPKIVANIGGIAHKALKSRFITIHMERTETRIERFSLSRHGQSLEEKRSRLEDLFQQDELRQRIQTFYERFEGIDDHWGRETDLWSPLLAIAQTIDFEKSKAKIHDRLLAIAKMDIERRSEESFFMDWDTKHLFSIFNYLESHNFDSETFIVAEDLRNHVANELKPKFNLRTERLGRILQSNSLLLKRKVKWIKTRDGHDVQKTCYQIDKFKLSKLIRKFDRYVEVRESSPIITREDLAEVGRPTNWPKDKDPT